MAITLNLLPQDKIVSKSLAKFLQLSRVLGVVVLTVFVIYSIGVGIVMFLNNDKLKTLEANNVELKSKVAELQTSEQQIVLIKDRIKKIETVKSIPSALNNLTAVIGLISNLSERSKVTELDADTKKVDLTVNFKSNFDMTSFMDQIKSTNSFKSITLSSYGLNPTSGYLISLGLLNTK